MIGWILFLVGTRHSNNNFNVTVTLGQQEQADIGVLFILNNGKDLLLPH